MAPQLLKRQSETNYIKHEKFKELQTFKICITINILFKLLSQNEIKYNDVTIKNIWKQVIFIHHGTEILSTLLPTTLKR